jgi:hypothetical protein
MDFLQRVGAGISLTPQLLYIGRHFFPLKGRELGFPKVQRLITAGRKGPLYHDLEEKEVDEPGEDWEGTVELAETVTLPPLSVRIARCRVIRRGDSMVVKVPRNKAVLLDLEGLPGIYLARIVATLEGCSGRLSSMDASGSEPYVVTEKSSLVETVFSPRSKFVVGCDGVAGCDGSMIATSNDGELTGTSSGECLSELPGDGARVAAIVRGRDLQSEFNFLPVENLCGNQVDTVRKDASQEQKGWRIERENNNQSSTKPKRGNIQQRTQVLGYVPMQIANLSLEEVELKKQTYLGVASPLQLSETQVLEGHGVSVVQRGTRPKQEKFEGYLQEKLAHVQEDRLILENVLRQYKHLFYGLGNKELGCTTHVEHSIETGDARPIKKNPYRILRFKASCRGTHR